MTKFQLSPLLPALLAVGAFAFTAGCSKSDEDGGNVGTSLTTVGAEDDTSGDKGEAEGEGEGDGDGDTGAGDGDGEMFLMNADLPGANTCDPWAQDCPEDEKCAAWASEGGTWDANKCVPLLGNGVTGDECMYDGAAQGTDTCDVGYMCYYTTDGIGSCIPLCTGNPDTKICPDNFNCSISNQGSLLLCLNACDPLLQDCAQVDSGCFWDGSLFNCDPAGDLLEGEPCGFINDCSAGHVCMGAESLPACNGSACCAGFCDLSAPNCQIANTECIAFYDEGQAPPGLEDVGVCVLPGA